MAKLQWPSASIVLIALLLAPLPVVATDEDDWSQARAAGVAAFGRKDYVAAEKQYQLALKLTASMKQSDPRVAESMEDLAKLRGVGGLGVLGDVVHDVDGKEKDKDKAKDKKGDDE